MIVETTVGAEKPPSARTVSLPAQELVGGPTVDVSKGKSRSPSGGDSNAVSPFNHQISICGAVVTAPDEMHHSVAAAAGMCTLLSLLRTEATLKRPGGPDEEQGLTSLKGKASL